MARRAAFFDVDGTLTTRPTLFTFLTHHLTASGTPPAAADAAVARLRAMSRAGAPRQETLRAYARHFAGTPVDRVLADGRTWYAAELRRGGLWRTDVVAALRLHRDGGDLIVLVSGSFPACLGPVAAEMGAHVLLCSRPSSRDGHYTGALPTPMIGEHKAEAVRELAAERGIDLAASAAYGDHISDVPLLALVGRPLVVGDDPVMADRAARHGWATHELELTGKE